MNFKNLLSTDLQQQKTEWRVLISAFVIGQLEDAFRMGFVIYIPFLVIDMLVASILLSLGMHMLSPTMVSLPLKLLLFVSVDGWSIIGTRLVQVYESVGG